MKNIVLIAILGLVFLMAACQNSQSGSQMPGMSATEHSKMSGNLDANSNSEFEKLCKDRTPDNWMNMKPTINGKFTSDKSCWGCMSDDGMSHFCSIEEYKEYLSSKK